MTKKWYEKVHTFRLSKEDRELYEYLESIQRMRKSEVIRNMLLFYLENTNKTNDYSHSSSVEFDDIDKSINELKELLIETKELVEKGEETNETVLNTLQNAIGKGFSQDELKVKEKEDQVEEPPEKEEADNFVNNSVNSMLNAFGVDFD